MSIPRSLPLSVMQSQPLSVRSSSYRIRMQSEGKKTVRANVLAMLSHASEMRVGESGVTRLKKVGLAQGTAQRLLDDVSDVRLETLDQLSQGLNVEPWQLLVPSLNPAALPVLADKTDASLLGDDLVAALGRLSPEDLAKAANTLRAHLGMPVQALPQGAASGEFRTRNGTHGH